MTSEPQPPTKISSNPNGLPEEIVFFCKDCRELSEVKRVGRQYVYTCSKCGTKNVAFGTRKSIMNFFHIKEEAH